MRKLLLALGVAPLMAGTAMAAEPLTDNQMDTVTAGLLLPGGIQLPPTLPDRQVYAPYIPSAHTQFPVGVNPFELVGLSLPEVPGPSTGPSGPPAPN